MFVFACHFFSLQKKWDVILGGSGAQFLFAFWSLCLLIFFVFAGYSDIGREVELVGCL